MKWRSQTYSCSALWHWELIETERLLNLWIIDYFPNHLHSLGWRRCELTLRYGNQLVETNYFLMALLLFSNHTRRCTDLGSAEKPDHADTRRRQLSTGHALKVSAHADLAQVLQTFHLVHLCTHQHGHGLQHTGWTHKHTQTALYDAPYIHSVLHLHCCNVMQMCTGVHVHVDLQKGGEDTKDHIPNFKNHTTTPHQGISSYQSVWSVTEISRI